MAVHFHEEDLPAGVLTGTSSLAVDTETMGLITHRDRLCVVQISDGTGDEHLVRFNPGSSYDAPNLKAVLEAAGATPADVVRLRTYVVDHSPEKLGPVLGEVAAFFGDATPAPNTFIGVACLALPDFLVEIEATAALS